MGKVTDPSPVAEILLDWLIDHELTLDHLAAAMCEGKSEDFGVHRLTLDLMFAIAPSDPHCVLGEEMAGRLAPIIGRSTDFLLWVDAVYRDWIKANNDPWVAATCDLVAIGCNLDEETSPNG